MSVGRHFVRTLTRVNGSLLNLSYFYGRNRLLERKSKRFIKALFLCALHNATSVLIVANYFADFCTKLLPLVICKSLTCAQ